MRDRYLATSYVYPSREKCEYDYRTTYLTVIQIYMYTFISTYLITSVVLLVPPTKKVYSSTLSEIEQLPEVENVENSMAAYILRMRHEFGAPL